jgi:predicted transcriptional regulator
MKKPTIESIKQKIQESGIKKKNLAERIGISKEYLSGILSERIKPKDVTKVTEILQKLDNEIKNCK